MLLKPNILKIAKEKGLSKNLLLMFSYFTVDISIDQIICLKKPASHENRRNHTNYIHQKHRS